MSDGVVKDLEPEWARLLAPRAYDGQPIAIDAELRAALASDELKDLVREVAEAKASDNIERDLLRRQSEIELDLSAATAQRDEAVARLATARRKVVEESRTGWHRYRLWLAMIVLAGAAIVAAGSQILGWAVGLGWSASWSSPFSAFWYGVAWTGVGIAIVVACWEAYFYWRRHPRIRLQAQIAEGVASLTEAVDAAQSKRSELLTFAVREHVTEILNLARGPRWASRFRVRTDAAKISQQLTEGEGLSEVTNDDNRVTTDVQQHLISLLTNLPGASIGISGPRGVGKSSLLTSLCGSNPTIDGRIVLAIHTSAPVEYDGRDFLLHLFSSLCRQVLRTEGQEDALKDARKWDVEEQRWRRTSLLATSPRVGRLLLFVGTTFLIVAFALAGVQSLLTSSVARSERASVAQPIAAEQQAAQRAAAKAKGAEASAQKVQPQASAVPSGPATSIGGSSTSALPPEPDPSIELLKALIGSPMMTLGLVLVLLGMLAPFLTGPFGRLLTNDDRRRIRYYGERNDLIERAITELRNIAFQRSYTSGWSGALKLPVGLDLGRSGGLTVAERPESLPELVERFRTFVSDVAASYQSIVLIGIDELDKLRSAQQAEAFLNGVKAVFGIPRCFYLISVSEHALAAFDRRGLGFRDAFDSALDDIVHVDFLTLEQSRALLNRRVRRLPDPFLQLCHMLSGGLPRDLIRQARALLALAKEMPKGVISLRAAAEALIARDLEARRRAVSIQLRTITPLPQTNELLVAVAELPKITRGKESSEGLEDYKTRLAQLYELQDSENGRETYRLAEEMAAYYQLMVLVLEATYQQSTQGGWRVSDDHGLADKVAEARQALEIGVALSKTRLLDAELALGEIAKAIEQRGENRRSRKARL